MHVHLWRFLKEGFTAFIDDNALSRGAAIAFYAVTAMAPVLFIATTIAGWGLGHAAARGAIHDQLRQIMSNQSANLVQIAIMHVQGASLTFTGKLAGIVTLIVTASGVFTEIQDALNVIWHVPRKESYFHEIMRGRVVSFGLVVALGLLLMISMVFAAGIGVIGHYFDRYAAFSHFLAAAINLGVSFLLITLLFAAIYKTLPNRRLYWRDVMVGAVGTAILFEVGQFLIAFYLARFVSANIYGAAGGVIVLLVWVYYSAQIFLLGAEFTKVWTRHYGRART